MSAGEGDRVRGEKEPAVGSQRWVGATSSAKSVRPNDGHALAASVRRATESLLDYDFLTVRIHTGEAAAASADRVGAEAYTVGNDIVFARGRYAPDTAGGRRLLTHELAHVVQQSQREVVPRVSTRGEAAEQAAAGVADGLAAGAVGGRPVREVLVAAAPAALQMQYGGGGSTATTSNPAANIPIAVSFATFRSSSRRIRARPRRRS